MYVAKYNGKQFIITYVAGNVKGGMRARTKIMLWRMVRANKAYIRDMSKKGRAIFTDYTRSNIIRTITTWVCGKKDISTSFSYN